jgi:thioredoxin 2
MIIVCPSCGAKNRVPEDKLNAQPTCGQCHQNLITLAPIELNEQNFSNFVSHSDLPIMIDLWAEWCGPCKMMAPHFAEVAKNNPHVVFAKIDTEANPRLSALKQKVMSIPTLVLFKNGEPIDQRIGALTKTQLEDFLNQHI